MSSLVSGLISPNDNSNEQASFCLVGVGASAGGLRSISNFFQNVSPDSGLSFVIIQHLSPEFKSVMDELLSRHTDIPIRVAKHGDPVGPNQILLIPPGKTAQVHRGRIQLDEMDRSTGEAQFTIDHFFKSLARDFGNRSIAIVLSGTGSDGSRGITDVHAQNGLVFVEDPASAEFDGMPLAAIKTGIVDGVHTTDELADVLRNSTPQPANETIEPKVTQDDSLELLESDKLPAESLNLIYEMLKESHEIDFSQYKPATIIRRLERRLELHAKCNIDAYIKKLQNNNKELNVLFEDLLIGVTDFFRDDQPFTYLEEHVIPNILERVPKDDDIRVWIPACSTGEEAYTIAILFYEALDRARRPINLKILATDIHQSVLDRANQGNYTEEQMRPISDERKARFFSRTATGYQVAKDIRKPIVFAKHDIINNAPFTNLDLVTCRNLLIYFQSKVQSKAVSLLHFGLKKGGYLMLGSSDSLGDYSDEFDRLDKLSRIYRKRRDVRLNSSSLTVPRGRKSSNHKLVSSNRPMQSGTGRGSRIYDHLIDRFMPPSLLLSHEGELIEVLGGANRLLRFKARQSPRNIFDLIETNGKSSLKNALDRAIKYDSTILLNNIFIGEGDSSIEYNVEFHPIRSNEDEPVNVLITFLLAPRIDAQSPADGTTVGEQARGQVRALQNELGSMRSSLEDAIEQLENSNHDLQSSNEELVSANEELQAVNEELQSLNEELRSVNAEYEGKIEELAELNDDVEHMLQGTDVGFIFLDNELRIRKYTARIAELFDLEPSDISRKLSSFSHRIRYDHLMDDLNKVLETGDTLQTEVRNLEGDCFFLRLLPYRIENRNVNGILLTLIDISALEEANRKITYLSSIVESTDDAVIGLDLDGKITSWNTGAEKLYGYLAEEIIQQEFKTLVPDSHRDEIADILQRLACGERVKTFSTKRLDRDGRELHVSAALSPISDNHGNLIGVSSISRDISDQIRMAQRIETEYSAVLRLVDSRTVVEAANAILKSICETHDIPVGEFWIRQRSSDSGIHLKRAAVFPERNQPGRMEFQQFFDAIDSTMEYRQGIQGFASAKRKIIWWNSLEEGAKFIRHQAAKSTGLKSGFAVPVMVGKQCDAVMCFFTRHEKIPNKKHFASMLESIARSLSQYFRHSKAESRLEQAHKRLQSIINSALDAIISIDQSGQVTGWNPQAEALFGYTENEATGKKLADLIIPPKLRKDHQDGLKHFLRTGESLVIGKRLELDAIDKNHREFPVELTVCSHPSGKEFEFTGFVRDISERRQHEEEIRSGIRRREEFLAMLAHELRNPLSAVQSASELINSGRLSNDRLDEHSGLPDSLQPNRVIKRQTSQMTRLLDDLLDVSRLSLNKIQLVREVVDLRDTVNDAVQAVNELACEKKMDIRITLPDQAIWVDGDPARLKQIQTNLLSNAIKYSNSGQSVSLKLSTNSELAVLRVEDQGIGIDPAFRSRIFELFSQLDRNKAGSRGGLGVGLNLVQSLVELHGGTITVESDGEDKGSVFQVAIPLARPEEPNLVKHDLPKQEEFIPPKETDDQQSRSKRILVIDDEEDNRLMLTSLLQLNGYESIPADGGKEGMRLIHSFQPDVAIIDIDMPEMNGYEIVKLIRSDSNISRQTVLIALTGYGQKKDIETAYAAGFDYHVTKPFDFPELEKLLDSLKPIS